MEYYANYHDIHEVGLQLSDGILVAISDDSTVGLEEAGDSYNLCDVKTKLTLCFDGYAEAITIESHNTTITPQAVLCWLIQRAPAVSKLTKLGLVASLEYFVASETAVDRHI